MIFWNENVCENYLESLEFYTLLEVTLSVYVIAA